MYFYTFFFVLLSISVCFWLFFFFLVGGGGELFKVLTSDVLYNFVISKGFQKHLHNKLKA